MIQTLLNPPTKIVLAKTIWGGGRKNRNQSGGLYQCPLVVKDIEPRNTWWPRNIVYD
jgi:hypothetical protein